MINRKKKSNDPMGGAFTSRHSGFNQINLSSTLQTKSPSSKLKGIKAQSRTFTNSSKFMTAADTRNVTHSGTGIFG